MDKNKKNAVDYYGEIDNSNTSGETTVYDDALAKVKRDQNYKSFYNNAIQLYNMKNNAQKYLDNELAANGLNSQGYGSSARAGINNNAINLYEDNLNKYNETESSITEDAYNRYNTKQAELDNQLAAFIQNDINNGNYDSINKHLANYGYMSLNEDGSYAYTEKWNNLDNERKAYIQSIIDDKENETSSSYGGLYSYSSDSKIPAYDSAGMSVGTQSGKFNVENDTLSSGILTGEIEKDSYIRLKNESGNNIYLYYGKDGNLYYITPSNYNSNAKNQNSYYIEGRDTNVYKGKNKK